MKIKSLLLGSAAAVVAVSGARAADAVVIPEPEAVEYVRVCDAAGTGFFFIPGTETCLRIGGYVRYNAGFGDMDGWDTDADNQAETWSKQSRFNLDIRTYKDTDFGALTTRSNVNFNYTDGTFAPSFDWNYIDLAGLRIGYARSLFTTFTGYGIATDWGGDYGFLETNLVQYNFSSGAFSGSISLEQQVGGVFIDDYMPHVAAGIGFDAGMVDLTGVLGYDTVNNAWAGKIRADAAVIDGVTLSLQLLYTEAASAYGAQWVNGGDTFSVNTGFTADVSDNATIGAQVQWIDGVGGTADKWNASAMMTYNVDALTIMPEVHYTTQGGTDSWGGFLRFQRSF